MFFAFLSCIPSTIESSKLEVCFAVEVFLGRFAVAGFFFFSELAIAFASLCSRSLSVNGFFTGVFPILEALFLTGADLDFTVFFAADFLLAEPVEVAFFAGVFVTGFFGHEDIYCLAFN